VLSPASSRQHAFCPFHVLERRLAVLFDQILNQRPKRLMAIFALIIPIRYRLAAGPSEL
jgi:hypothetical protein